MLGEWKSNTVVELTALKQNLYLRRENVGHNVQINVGI
jgi:hypothetical protein